MSLTSKALADKWGSLLPPLISAADEAIMQTFGMEGEVPPPEPPDIYPSAILEVWLSGQPGPEICLVIEEDEPLRPQNPCSEIYSDGKPVTGECTWAVLVNDKIFVLPVSRIFRAGTATKPPFDGYTLPIVRKAYSGLYANQIVSIQPMSMPSGLLGRIFEYDYKYNAKEYNAISVGSSVQRTHSTKDLNVIFRSYQRRFRRNGGRRGGRYASHPANRRCRSRVIQVGRSSRHRVSYGF